MDSHLPGSGRGLLTALALPFRDGLFRGFPQTSLRLALAPWPHREFDQTLGFPGEGPPWQAHEAYAVLGPRNSQDCGRKEARAGTELPREACFTEEPRAGELSCLQLSCLQLSKPGYQGDDAFRHFFNLPPDPELISTTLGKFGREAFEAGRSYWRYAETINTIAGIRLSIRRQLHGAWDVAYGWMALEPHTHHVALPAVVLLGILTASLLWGWVREAGMFALCWGGLLRIGEALQATRNCLVLPQDVLHVNDYILLRINEPKTRLRTARHQAAKVEHKDLVELISRCFVGFG